MCKLNSKMFYGWFFVFNLRLIIKDKSEIFNLWLISMEKLGIL